MGTPTSRQVVAAGGVIVEVLETKNFIFSPAKVDLDAWVNKYQLPVTSVIDAPGKGMATFNALGQREATYIIELATMSIVRKYDGTRTGIDETGAMSAMREILVLRAAP